MNKSDTNHRGKCNGDKRWQDNCQKVGNMYSKDKSYLGELSGKIGKFPKQNRSCVR